MGASKIVLRIVSLSFSLLLLVVIVFGIIQVGKESYSFGYRVYTETAMEKAPGTDESVILQKGMNIYDISKVLLDEKLIRNKYLFMVQLELSEYRGKIKPGSYILNTSMTSKDMMKVMSNENDENDKSNKK